MSTKKEYKGIITDISMLNSDTAYISIKCEEIVSQAVPGQFVSISCSRFLKRPFGIANVNITNGTFDIGVKIVGEGSSEIARFEAGDIVDVLGPLGNGFDFVNLTDKNVILVSGGTGVFPINFARKYCEENSISYKLVQGFRDESQVILNDSDVILCTDSGDVGIKGNCCDGLNTLDSDFLNNSVLLCVGPRPMMKACGEWAISKGIKCYVSLEQRMACGIGICLVCVCKIKALENGEEFKHLRCCKDGPVFDYEEVVW